MMKSKMMATTFLKIQTLKRVKHFLELYNDTLVDMADGGGQVLGFTLPIVNKSWIKKF